MALQSTSVLPSTISTYKEGKSSLKETCLFGVSVPTSNQLKPKLYYSLRNGKESGKREQPVGTIRAQTVTTTPAVNKTTPEAKKPLRKGNVMITGASSGLGLATAKALAEAGKWHVIMACRNFLKAEKAAKSAGMMKENYTVMHLDLASLESVRQFVDNFLQSGMPLDVLVCNAAVYLPTAKEPTFTAEGFELSVGTNHLGHFLLARLLLDNMKRSDYPSRRLIIVGSITGNTNTLAGNVPPKANLGDLRGLAGGLNGLNSSSMIDGGEFDGAKAYKDSKVCNMLMMQEFHRRYHDETGITFGSLYPGCIAETGLFREHIALFKLLFPPFQKYITKGYVSEEDAGKRLAQVVSDPTLSKSGVYWSWNKNSASFENQLSKEASDPEKAKKLLEMERIKHSHVEVRGLKLHVTEIGTGSKIVLFLHGFPEIWYSWRHQMVAVADAGYRAVAIDFRGYGLSETPPEPEKPTFIDLDDAVALLDTLGVSKAYLVGKDFGAMIVNWIAVLYPSRVSGIVTLGIPFMLPGPNALPAQCLPKGLYIMRWLEPGRAEADFGRFDVKTVIKKIYILFSGSELPAAADDQEIMDLVDASTPLPPWFSEEDLSVYASLYQKHGFSFAMQIPYRVNLRPGTIFKDYT